MLQRSSIDDELELGRLLARQIGRTLAAQYAIHIADRQLEIGAVEHQAAVGYEVANSSKLG